MLYQDVQSLFQLSSLRERLEAAVQFLSRGDLSALPVGRVEIMGDEVYAQVLAYDTKPKREVPFETHLKYLDLQYLVCGEEMAYVARGVALGSTSAYDPDKDIEFFDAPDIACALHMKPGQIALFDFADYHQPGCQVCEGTPLSVKKIVVKVKGV